LHNNPILFAIIHCKSKIEVSAPPALREEHSLLHGKSLDAFKAFCAESWEQSLDLVDRPHQRQAARNELSGP